MQYELLFLVGHGKEANLEAIEKAVEKYIEEIGGTLEDARWESKRRLAYPIKHEERGVYVARRFTLPIIDVWANDVQTETVDRIGKLSQLLHLYDDVLRFSIVRSEELESLADFSTRKEEERKTHRQSVEKKERETRAKRPGASRTTTSRGASPIPPTPTNTESKPATASVSKEEAPQKEISVAEINDKLDEILNG